MLTLTNFLMCSTYKKESETESRFRKKLWIGLKKTHKRRFLDALYLQYFCFQNKR